MYGYHSAERMLDALDDPRLMPDYAYRMPDRARSRHRHRRRGRA